jgi:hypothetical protein
VIACNYNVVKILVAVAQLAFALVTLYRTRGDQIAMYGYAAFGLTVAQYAWMSLLNLAGSLICPNYPSVFIVESQTLKRLRKEIDDARKTDLYPLSGTVGELTEATEKEILENSSKDERPGAAIEVLGPYVGAVPIAIIGALSKFTLGGSALYQRVWTIMWPVFGCVVGSLASNGCEILLNRAAMSQLRLRGVSGKNLLALVVLLALAIFVTYAAPAIGGFVVVAEMILQYGVCIRLREASV